jgi:hypothetical protein
MSHIRIKRKGLMPMPVDVQLTFKNRTKENHYVPMYLMFGEKPAEDSLPRTSHPSWKWTDPLYTFSFKRRLTELSVVEIDPTQRMADIDRRNNKLELKW